MTGEATIPLAGIPNGTLGLFAGCLFRELAAQRQKQVLERMLRCDKITEEKVDSILAHNRAAGSGENLSECCHH